MSRHLNIFVCLFLFSSGLTGQTPGNQWNGIVPLRSTKADVEKLLGAPMEKTSYDTEKERVTVWYAKGTCDGEFPDIWKVPKNTVVGIIVSPKENIPLPTFLGGLVETFEKIPVMHFKDRFLYFNKDGSIELKTQISPDGSEKILSIVYAPTEQDNRLRCESPKTKK